MEAQLYQMFLKGQMDREVTTELCHMEIFEVGGDRNSTRRD